MSNAVAVIDQAQVPTFAGKPFPPIILDAGENATRRFVEFFTANIRNPNTRAAYAQAVSQFLSWCESRRLRLRDLTPFLVAAYIEELSKKREAPTVKQHLASVRMLFDWLVVGQVLPMNPASSVRGPKHIVKRGKTPSFPPRTPESSWTASTFPLSLAFATGRLSPSWFLASPASGLLLG